MQLSLIKCATAPNPEADQGQMSFTYSICPHAGSLESSDTVKEAYYLNYPMTAIKAEGTESTIPESFSMLSIDRENVICETVKEAENGNDLVLRLYESKNSRSKVNIKLGFKAEKAYLCDMLENEIEELPLNDGVISTEIKGFEILTIKVK
jgi:alpha-mannosidase